jgi:hypothetical protein
VKSSVDPLEELEELELDVAPEEEDDEDDLPLDPLLDVVAPDEDAPSSAGSTLPPHAAASEARAGRRTRRRRWWRIDSPRAHVTAPVVPHKLIHDFNV